MPDVIELLAIQQAFDQRHNWPKEERHRYRETGWQIIEPGTFNGEAIGFHGREWDRSSFLARKGTTIQIALIMAKHPRSGALTRLRDSLEAFGFTVQFVAPLPIMRDWLQRQGYACTTIGSTFADRMDIWSRP